MNPLTGLPGNKEVKKQLEGIIDNPGKLAVYIDISDFKPYNEVYGFTCGDNIILTLADILEKCCKKVCEDSEYIIGHIGGDDFIIIIEEERLENLYDLLDREFLKIRDSFYNQQDISRRSIVGWNRQGERTVFPLMGICGAAFSPYKQKFNTAEQISEFATHLKEVAKSRRDEDNTFITPEKLSILPGSLREFIMDDKAGLLKKRTVIEAMGESGFVHCGRLLMEMLEEPMHIMLKKSIIFALGRLRYNPAESLLLKYTEDKSPHLRTRAVEALGYIGGAKHLDKIGSMIGDPNAYVAVMAAKSIGNIGHPEGLKYLKDIPDDASRWLKIESAITRCRMGDRQAVNEMEKLINDPNPVFRNRSGQALVLIPSEESFDIIYKAFKTEKVPYVRNTLIISLGNIVEKLSIKGVKKRSLDIMQVYRASPENLKPFLYPSIGKTREKEVKDILEEKISCKSRWERCMAVKGMVNYGCPGHVQLIRKSMQDFSAKLRAESALALGELEDTGSMEILRRSLKDSDNMVRRKTSEAVLKIVRDNSSRKER
ncbi:HEAT repeat domain-containing protein [Elusimicrobiota bacterium]